MTTARLGIVAVLAALVGASVVSGQARILVLQGGTLIDGTGRPAIIDPVVVVEGDRIRAVGRRGEVAIPPGATVIDTSGRTVLPGLVDMHLHTRPWKIPLYLAHGVTTVGDIHNDTQWILGQRALLRSGVIQGPRLFVSGARITGLNGPRLVNAAGTIVEDPSFVRDAAAARGYVRYLHDAGVDFIKVDATITDEQLSAVLDEAWTFGLPVLGHLQNIDVAMSFGMKEMEHLPPFFRAQLIREGKPLPGPGPQEQLELARAVDVRKFGPLISKMIDQGVIVDVALYNWIQPVVWPVVRPEVERLANDPGLAFVPSDEKAAWVQEPGPTSEAYKTIVAFLTQYAAAGGKILVSTDGIERSRIVPGLGLHIVMQGVAAMGIPAMTVIQAATLWPAQAMGVDRHYGSVEPGKAADFVVVDGDPLADMSATRKIRTVIMNGRVVDTAYDPKWTNPLPRPSDAMQP